MKDGKNKKYDYDSIHPGHYHEAMLHGFKGQQFWLSHKFVQIIKQLKKPNASLLDVACGPGSLFFLIRKTNKKMKLTGIDIAKPQIDYAKKIVKNAHFLVADATKLTFKDNSFDYVTMIELVEHLTPQMEKKMLLEIRRVLKPGGRIIITTPNYRSFWPAFEWIWNRLGPVSYDDQHINKKNLKNITETLESLGFTVKYKTTYFIVSQFFTIFGFGAARKVFDWEKKLFPKFGMSLLIEVEK